MSFWFELHIKDSGIVHISGAHIFMNNIFHIFFSSTDLRDMLKSFIKMLFVSITLFIIHIFVALYILMLYFLIHKFGWYNIILVVCNFYEHKIFLLFS